MFDFNFRLKSKKRKKTKQSKPKGLSTAEIEFQNFRNDFLDPVLKKCQELFNKQSNSPKAADLVKSYLNRYLITPSPTRWNSLYDSVCLLASLIDEKPDEINDVMKGLNLDKIYPNDHAVLKEYIKVLKNFKL